MPLFVNRIGGVVQGNKKSASFFECLEIYMHILCDQLVCEKITSYIFQSGFQEGLTRTLDVAKFPNLHPHRKTVSRSYPRNDRKFYFLQKNSPPLLHLVPFMSATHMIRKPTKKILNSSYTSMISHNCLKKSHPLVIGIVLFYNVPTIFFPKQE